MPRWPLGLRIQDVLHIARPSRHGAVPLAKAAVFVHPLQQLIGIFVPLRTPNVASTRPQQLVCDAPVN